MSKKNGVSPNSHTKKQTKVKNQSDDYSNNPSVPENKSETNNHRQTQQPT